MDTNDKNSVLELLYTYDNFLTFLNDYFVERFEENRNLSKRYYAEKAGFKSHSLLVHILTGRRRATDNSLEKIANLLDLSSRDRDFLFTLAHYNQADSITERDALYLKLNKIKEKVEYAKLEKDMTPFYSKWYYPVIRELVVYSDWNGDYAKLAALIEPNLSETEAKEAVALLEDLSLIVKKGSEYIHNSDMVEAGEIDMYYLKKARRDMITASIDAAERYTPAERFYNNLTFNLDMKSVERIRTITEKYIEDIENIVNSQESSSLERVYQFNIQMFPLSGVYKNDH